MSLEPPLSLVVDNRETDLIEALNRYLPVFNASRGEAPRIEFGTMELTTKGVVFRRADNSIAYACKHETLASIEAQVPENKTIAQALGLVARAIADVPAYEAKMREAAEAGDEPPEPPKPMRFTVEQLDIGDIVVRRADNTVSAALERKAFLDVAASVADERYRSQKHSLLDTKESDSALVEYVFEVPTKQRGFLDPARQDVHFPGTKMRASTLRGVVENTAVRDGLATKFTEDIDETARHVVSRYVSLSRFDPLVGSEKRREQTASEKQMEVGAVRKRKQAGATPLTRFADALRAVPLVGDKTALDLADHFGNMAALCAALPDGTAYEFPRDFKVLEKKLAAVFAEVADVGPKIALSLYASLRGLDPKTLVAPPRAPRVQRDPAEPRPKKRGRPTAAQIEAAAADAAAAVADANIDIGAIVSAAIASAADEVARVESDMQADEAPPSAPEPKRAKAAGAAPKKRAPAAAKRAPAAAKRAPAAKKTAPKRKMPPAPINIDDDAPPPANGDPIVLDSDADAAGYAESASEHEEGGDAGDGDDDFSGVPPPSAEPQRDEIEEEVRAEEAPVDEAVPIEDDGFDVL